MRTKEEQYIRVMNECAAIKSQILRAKANGSVDKTWLAGAQIALINKSRSVEILKREAALEAKADRQSHADSVEKSFMQIAKSVLSEDQFKSLLTLAKKRTANQEKELTK